MNKTPLKTVETLATNTSTSNIHVLHYLVTWCGFAEFSRKKSSMTGT